MCQVSSGVACEKLNGFEGKKVNYEKASIYLFSSLSGSCFTSYCFSVIVFYSNYYLRHVQNFVEKLVICVC